MKLILSIIIVAVVFAIVQWIRASADFALRALVPFSNRYDVGAYDLAAVLMLGITVLALRSLLRQRT